MKLGYFPDVLYRDLDSTRRDDVEGLALVALPNYIRAVELVPVLIKGSRRWRDEDAAPHSSSIAPANFVSCASVMQSVSGRVGPMKCRSLLSWTFLSSSL